MAGSYSGPAAASSRRRVCKVDQVLAANYERPVWGSSTAKPARKLAGVAVPSQCWRIKLLPKVGHSQRPSKRCKNPRECPTLWHSCPCWCYGCRWRLPSPGGHPLAPTWRNAPIL